MTLEVTLCTDEEGVWIAEIPAIPGCGSEGATREVAVENIREAAQLCLQVRADLGMPLAVEAVTIDVVA